MGAPPRVAGRGPARPRPATRRDPLEDCAVRIGVSVTESGLQVLLDTDGTVEQRFVAEALKAALRQIRGEPRAIGLW